MLLSESITQFDILCKSKDDLSLKKAYDLISPFIDTDILDNNEKIQLYGRIGKCYHFGWGVKKDLFKAIHYLSFSSKYSAKWANELFDIYWTIDDSSFYREMMECVVPFAYKGDVGAMGRLGKVYKYGKGTIIDYQLSSYWLKKAFDKNDKWFIEYCEVLLLLNNSGSLEEYRSIMASHNFPKKYDDSWVRANKIMTFQMGPSEMYKSIIGNVNNNKGSLIEFLCYYIEDPSLKFISVYFKDNPYAFLLLVDSKYCGSDSICSEYISYNSAQELFEDCNCLLKVLNQKYLEFEPKLFTYSLNKLIDIGFNKKIIDMDSLKQYYKTIYLFNPVLSEIQSCYTILIEIFDLLCAKHGVKYAINSGTLLGSIRHNGFIPWDDDIDILMMRDDFTKLQTILNNDKESIFALISKPHSSRGGSVIISNQFRMKSKKHIAIGIMVFDYVDSNTDALWHEYQLLKTDLKNRVNALVINDRKRGLDPRRNPEIKSLYNQYNDKMVSLYGNANKEWIVVGFDSTNPNKKFIYKEDQIFPTSLVEFNNLKLQAPKNPCLLMDTLYGSCDNIWRFPSDIYSHAHIEWSEKTFKEMKRCKNTLSNYLLMLRSRL